MFLVSLGNWAATGEPLHWLPTTQTICGQGGGEQLSKSKYLDI